MLANLRALFGVVVDIVLLRRGPEHLPASPALLVVVVASFAVVAAVVGALVATPDQNWPLELAIVIGVTLLWYQVALRMADKRERFPQTMTALFAVLLLFAPLVMPLMSEWMTQVKAAEETKVPPSAWLGLLVLFLLFWRFLINVRIVRGAFEWPTFPAVILVLAQEFAMLLVLVAFLGMPSQPS